MTVRAFPVIHVPDDAGVAIEAMGSKPKFWYDDEVMGRCLFKQSRPGTGEDWAEKVAAEVAGLLGLAHAGVELAVWRDIRGTVSPSFVRKDDGLVHGNEILMQVVPGYPGAHPQQKPLYRVSQHTLDIVLAVVGVDVVQLPLDWISPPGIVNAAGVFVGYLLLDAWIGNTDRHHENWGFVFHREPGPPVQASCHLAPTFDHASSLGRNESDENRRNRLATKDSGYSVAAYVEKTISAFYAHEWDSKPQTTLGAFGVAALCYPDAGRIWLDRVESVSEQDTMDLVRRIPSDRISPVGIEFAQAMLTLNRQQLLRLRETLR